MADRVGVAGDKKLPPLVNLEAKIHKTIKGRKRKWRKFYEKKNGKVEESNTKR